MGYATAIDQDPGSQHWRVAVRVELSRTETNELFLSGDAMLSWPTDGLLPNSGDASIPERSGMFVSEVASQPEGLVIRYSDRASAERSHVLLRAQLEQAGINEGV